MRPKTLERPLLYGFVVVIGYVVDLLVFSVAVESGANVYVANTISFLVGATTNVALLRHYVFSKSRFGFAKDVVLTWFSNGLMFGVGMALFWVLIEILSINPYIAKIVSSSVTFVLNYLSRVRFFEKE